MSLPHILSHISTQDTKEHSIIKQELPYIYKKSIPSSNLEGIALLPGNGNPIFGFFVRFQ